jgi:hypothetical protein
MKHIKLFETFIDEEYLTEKKLTSPPKSYADAAFWDSKFKFGITDAFVDFPKYKNIIHSIAYDLGLDFYVSGKDARPANLNYYGAHITNPEGSEVIVRNAFDGDYSYNELKDAVEKWAKKKKLI